MRVLIDGKVVEADDFRVLADIEVKRTNTGNGFDFITISARWEDRNEDEESVTLWMRDAESLYQQLSGIEPVDKSELVELVKTETVFGYAFYTINMTREMWNSFMLVEAEANDLREKLKAVLG